MLELNKLYNMDCMQGMKEFPDGFFDLAIADPPYGIGIDGQKKRVCGNLKHNRKEHIRKSWDKTIPPPHITCAFGTRFKSTSDMGRKLLRSVS